LNKSCLSCFEKNHALDGGMSVLYILTGQVRHLLCALGLRILSHYQAEQYQVDIGGGRKWMAQAFFWKKHA
jgi:hypothetical protein